MSNWFLDTGVWILAAVLALAAAFGLMRLALRPLLRQLAQQLGRLPLLDIVAENDATFSQWVERILGLAMAAGATLAILAELGVDMTEVTSRLGDFGFASARWAGSHGLRVLAILVLGYLIMRAVGRVLPPLLRTTLLRGKQGIELEEAGKRANALSQVGQYAVNIMVVIVGGIMVLSEFGFNLAPVLAGVGIAGIALGFGAQHLVRDIIAGIFILVEDQYRVGDVASVGGKTGLVEGVSLRRTILRDLDGIVHSIPNGEIAASSNFTKSFSRVNLDISVAYKEDLDHVIRVLNRVGIGLARDDYFGTAIIEPPQVLRVNSFDDSGIGIKMVGVTRPIRQWEVMGELRRRIKREFDQEGIEIPFPHRTIYWGVNSHPRAEPVARGRTQRGVDIPVEEPQQSPPRDPWVQEELGGDGVVTVATEGREKVLENLMGHLDEVRQLLANPPVALFTDIDGTLAGISPTPSAVKLSPAVRQALGALSRRMTVVVLSGRDLAAARAVVGLNSVIYQGNHGVESWERGTTSVVAGAQPMARQIHRLARAARSSLSSHAGVSVEDKEYALAFHFRRALNPTTAHQAILRFLDEAPEARGLSIKEGKMVVEARLPVEANKGTALRSVVEQHGVRSALVLGDDLTDIDGFRMLAQLQQGGVLKGISVAVMGTSPQPAVLAAADYELADPEAVEIFLTWLAQETSVS